MDKNTMYLGIGATVVVAALVVVGMVLASGYAGTLTSLQTGTQSSLNSVSDRLNALKSETDQLNATANTNLIRTEAVIPALNVAWDDLASHITSGNTNMQNSLTTVNNNLMSELGSVNDDLSDDLGAVNSSLSNQLTNVNNNLNGTMTLINAAISAQLTTVYNNLHNELNSVYSNLYNRIGSVGTSISSELGAVNASVISQINAVNGTLSDLLLAMNMSLSDYLALMQGNLTDLEQKLWSLDESVKNDTKLIPDVLANITEVQGNLTSMNATLAAMNETIVSMLSGERMVVETYSATLSPTDFTYSIWVNSTDNQPFEVLAIYLRFSVPAEAATDWNFSLGFIKYIPPGAVDRYTEGYGINTPNDWGDRITAYDGANMSLELVAHFGATTAIAAPDGGIEIVVFDEGGFDTDYPPTIQLTVVARTAGGITVGWTADPFPY